MVLGTLLHVAFILLGLVLILVGANALTDGASAIAKRFGLSDLVVGLTVVAFGTSTPEFVISVLSASSGSADLSIGNVVGSNIFNILAIIGVTALVYPVKVERTVMTREIPMVVISSLVLLILGNTALLDNTQGSIIARSAGIFLLLFMFIFMWYMLASAKNAQPGEPEEQAGSAKKPMSVFKSIIWVVAGLAMLIIGGDRFVAGAVEIAHTLGVSEAVIGLTIAAMGTSLPELATSVVAACKGQTGLAVGNVIGSCIFNVFAVLGFAATITPLQFGAIGNLDLLTLLGASVMFMMFGWLFGKRTFTRIEGGIMTACYVAYIAVLVVNS